MPFSSGTTGLPKGVLLTHYNLVADATIATADGFIEYSTSSVILGFLPFFHIYGMVTVLSIGLYRGSTLVCASKFDRDKFFSVLQGHKVSVRGNLCSRTLLGL
jgi:acyl-CoA synthetase (AMP-forming)/AMP-acid ligase II